MEMFVTHTILLYAEYYLSVGLVAIAMYINPGREFRHLIVFM